MRRLGRQLALVGLGRRDAVGADIVDQVLLHDAEIGKLLIEILNRDYVIADLPTRVWWEGDGCVVLEEVELNYFSSRIQVNRSVVFDDGRQLEQEISVRAYSLHEVGKLMHAAGFRVLEVSGGYHTRGRFFGNQSRHIIVLAERKDPSAA